MSKSASESVHVLERMVELQHLFQEEGFDWELVNRSLVDGLDESLFNACEQV